MNSNGPKHRIRQLLVIDIWGFILRSGFFFSSYEMRFWIREKRREKKKEKTAETMEMELVVWRRMREWDYPGIMSALLNTITLYRSERDLWRIYFQFICLCKLGLYANKWKFLSAGDGLRRFPSASGTALTASVITPYILALRWKLSTYAVAASVHSSGVTTLRSF